MTHAFELIRKVLSHEVPPRAVLWGFLNKLNWLLGTGNRRYEFECLYLERCFDPWDYKNRDYEHDKYCTTLESALKWRRATNSVLEVGCSIGIFSKMLAPHFTLCVSVDFSREALKEAIIFNSAQKNLLFKRSDVRSLNLGQRFDVIICAEILYYVLQKDVERVVCNLDRHLASEGIIICVSGIQSRLARPMACFEQRLSSFLDVIYERVVQDPLRPYQIVIFARPAPLQHVDMKTPSSQSSPGWCSFMPNADSSAVAQP